MDLSDVFNHVARTSDDLWEVELASGTTAMIAHNGTLVAAMLLNGSEVVELNVHDHDSVTGARQCAEVRILTAVHQLNAKVTGGRFVELTAEYQALIAEVALELNL